MSYAADAIFSDSVLKNSEIAGIPSRFRNAHLHATLGPQNPIADVCREYVIQYGDTASGAILTGPTGMGKTTYACSMANEVLRTWGTHHMDVHVQFCNINTHLSRLLDNRYFKRYDLYANYMSKLEYCDLLIVDDLLHIPDTEWAKDVLYRIYEARYANELRTITTLNLILERGDNGALDWSPISDIFNEPFMRRVVESAGNFIISL